MQQKRLYISRIVCKKAPFFKPRLQNEKLFLLFGISSTMIIQKKNFMSLIRLLIVIFLLISEDFLISFNTDILSKARGSKLWTLKQKKRQF